MFIPERKWQSENTEKNNCTVQRNWTHQAGRSTETLRLGEDGLVGGRKNLDASVLEDAGLGAQQDLCEAMCENRLSPGETVMSDRWVETEKKHWC